MKLRKITSIVLTCIIAVNLAGCGNKPYNEDYVSILSDMGFKEVDVKTYTGLDDHEGDLEGGKFCVATEDKDIVKLERETHAIYADADDLSSIIYAAKIEIRPDYTHKEFGVCILTFKDEEDAENQYEEICGIIGYESGEYGFWETYGEFAYEEEDNYQIIAGELLYMDDIYSHFRLGLYLNGNEVIYITSGSEDTVNSNRYSNLVDDFCEGAGIANPEELLD